MSQSEKEKEDAKHKLDNKPDSKVPNVLFITDVAQYNHDKHYHPVERALEHFEAVNGSKFNIYMQSRYKIDQRTIGNPKIRKMIIEVFEGDVVPALQKVFAKYPDVVAKPDYVMTMSGPMNPSGYKVLIDKLAVMSQDESIENIEDKWNFGKAKIRFEEEDDKAAKKAAAKKAAKTAKKAAADADK